MLSWLHAHRFCRDGLQLDLRERRGLDLWLGLLGHRLQLRLEVDGRRLEWHEERRETSLRIGLKEYVFGRVAMPCRVKEPSRSTHTVRVVIAPSHFSVAGDRFLLSQDSRNLVVRQSDHRVCRRLGRSEKSRWIATRWGGHANFPKRRETLGVKQ